MERCCQQPNLFQICHFFLSHHLKMSLTPAGNFATHRRSWYGPRKQSSVSLVQDRNLFSLLQLLSMVFHPRLAKATATGTTAKVLAIVLPWLSLTDQLAIIVTMKFLEEPIVPAPGACEIMYLDRILDSPTAGFMACEHSVEKLVRHFAHLWT